MITLIHGVESYLVRKQKNAKIESFHIDKDNTTVIDGSDSDFQIPSLIHQCNTFSLFEEQRLIIVNNPSFLKEKAKTESKRASKKKEKEELTLKLFAQYCDYPNPNTEVLMVLEGYEAKKNAFYKVLESHSGKTVNIIHCDAMKPWELEKAMDRILKERGYDLTREARKELSLRVGNSISAFYTCLDQMDAYGKKSLDSNDLIHLCSFNPDINAFKLGNAFIRNDLASALATYRDCLQHGSMSAQSLLPMFASQLKKGFQIMRCYEMHLSNKEISERTGSTRVDKDIDTYILHESSWYLQKLCTLSKLDIAMKSGILSTKEAVDTAMEWFLLENAKVPYEKN